MKQISFILLLFFAFAFQAQAQVKATLKEEVRTMSEGAHNALVVDLPNCSADKVGDIWKTFVKKNYKGKVKYKKKDKLYISDDATVKDMSENTVDIYAMVQDKGEEGAEIVIWFNLGVSYLSQKEFPNQFQVAEEVVNKFTKKLSADLLEDLLKAEEKTLKELEKDMKELEKDEKKLTKDIEDYKETIKKMEENIKQAEEDIKKSKEDQGTKKKEVDDQTQVVEELKQKIKANK
ncbi:hypothetical protein [Saprospira grandis]|uniref:hypothetical protein n=1 Tax=Saprospira grandis TaxID=1008 RepID=UPI0022DD8CB7|nr:hypothetical protein [Saprospira grandis]WBM75879.1 hypothetical protein OP864_06465 [Saprospira grandis]